MTDRLTPERLEGIRTTWADSEVLSPHTGCAKHIHDLLAHIEALEERDRKVVADLKAIDADMSSRLRKIEKQVNAIADERDRYQEALERIDNTRWGRDSYGVYCQVCGEHHRKHHEWCPIAIAREALEVEE